MIPGSFAYHRPGSVDEAIALLEQFGDDGKVLAGGHSLIPMMKLRLAEPAHLIDLQAVGALKGIAVSDGEVRIGAMTTQAELLASDGLCAALPILPEAIALIADPQVRYCGTIGGNLANGDPGNDLPAVMMVLGAEFELKGPNGTRTVPANGFYRALFETDLAANEVLVEVRIPKPPAGHGYAYQKLKRKVGDYATAAAAVMLVMDGARCAEAAITLTNLASTPLNAAAAAQALIGGPVDGPAIAQAAAAAIAITDPVADLRGPVDYRKSMAGVMTSRAIEQALGRARGG